MVSEHDDTLKSIPEQLTVDIFSVPNIQVGVPLSVRPVLLKLTNVLIVPTVVRVRHQHDGDVHHRTARSGNVRREFRDGLENGPEPSTSVATRSGRQVLLGRLAAEP